MVKFRIEKKPEFKIVGRKTWIGGTDNESFGRFWEESRSNGLIDTLHKLRENKQDAQLNSWTFGVSCVEKDPTNREFYFFIATESDVCPEGMDLEEYKVSACEWAVFENKGNMPFALVDAEMYAFGEWLPNSDYVHALAPELELYPYCDAKDGETLVEFWLPIQKKM